MRRASYCFAPGSDSSYFSSVVGVVVAILLHHSLFAQFTPRRSWMFGAGKCGTVIQNVSNRPSVASSRNMRFQSLSWRIMCQLKCCVLKRFW